VKPYLIGEDPTAVERLTAVFRDAEILGPPLYCMEIPLWDIIGKRAGLPVYQLWGGYSSRVKVYCATAEVRSPEERVDDVRRLRIAGGEDNHGLHEFKLLLDRGCYDVLEPDALLSEGVFQLRKVAALAEAAFCELAPHTWGNGIGLLANLHLAASAPNCTYLEYPHDPPSGWTAAARDRMLAEPLAVDRDGFVTVPDRPGFGIVLADEDAPEAGPVGHGDEAVAID